MMPNPTHASAKARRTASESAAFRGEQTEASRNAGRALGSFLAYIAYWILTLAGNSDAAFVLGRTVRLPLLGIAVPLDFFFFATPLAGLLIFLAFQFTLRGLAELARSAGPEGRPAASTHRTPGLAMSVLGGSGLSIRDVGGRTLVALFWASLPATLVYHFLRYLRIHEFTTAYVLGGLVMAMTIVVAGCWWTRPGRRAARPLLRTWMASLAIVAVLVCQAVMVIGMIPWAAKGYYSGSFSPRPMRNFLQPLLSVELRGLNLAAPDFVPGLVARPKGLGLRGTHLEGARLYMTKARDVDFRFARIIVAVVDSCDLQGANFRMVDFTQTYFLYSDLARADLTSAVLRAAMFIGCDLKAASFRCCGFTFGKFYYCQAVGADFRLASFDGEGDVFETNFETADLEGVDFHLCRVDQCLFTRANLKDADFREAELWKTDFSQADLEGANFLGATRLEAEQLSRARTLYRAKMDPPLSEKIKKNYPRLFEKPAEPGVR